MFDMQSVKRSKRLVGTLPIQKERAHHVACDGVKHEFDELAHFDIGRLVERLMLTEMPQLRYVLAGKMSLIGNRPLPDNVVASLRKEFPQVEDRFLTPGGLTGPIQLVGRDALSDAKRLEIELAYCDTVLHGYSPLLDFRILWLTVFGGVVTSGRMTPEEVVALLDRYSGRRRRPLSLRRATASPTGNTMKHEAKADAFGHQERGP